MIKIILSVLIGLSGVYGFQVCHRDWSQTIYYCEDDQFCCGKDQCCHPFSVAAIIGSVIGGIILLSFVIACICVCVQKSNTKTGRVVQPQQGVMFVNSSSYPQQNGYSQYPPTYYPPASQYPPSYNEPSYQPPAYSQETPGNSQTAYPPPPVFSSAPPNNPDK
ncbi:protein shisa-5-like [Mya arenaria]|uniref:protein shisa-5-like n=1 Tax=Mya arenaria TaxID=6604 RepID=UPI0022DF74DA|nr:protein shisa-5-like [Mya arenaria]